jgi:hypothetical protein
MKPNPLKRLLAVLGICMAAVAIAVPVASAAPIIPDDPSGARPAVPSMQSVARSTQSGKAKKKKTRRANQRPRHCPGSERTIATIQGCVK